MPVGTSIKPIDIITFNRSTVPMLAWLKLLLLIFFSVNSVPIQAVLTASPVSVTGQVNVSYTGLRLNRATNTYETQATLTNISSKAINIPVQLAIRNISQATVTLANASGALTDGTPTISIPLGDGVLSPGETVSGMLLKFNNPQKLNFTFAHTVLGVLPAANHPPVANAGGDVTTAVGTDVTLSGIASSDEDGNPLTYRWRIVDKPANSNASLNNSNSIQPTFININRKGSYRIELVVNDGQVDSQPAFVVVTTENSKPIARAGVDQTVKLKQTATLDGSNSSDSDQDPLTYHWLLLAKPDGSQAVLKNDSTQTPSLTPDKPGNYTVQLIVNDGLLDSLPDQLIVSTINSQPVADAGPNQTGTVGTQLTLDGSLSTDVDNDPLSYVWSLLTKPVNSSVELFNADRIQALLTPDQPGDYIAQLIVNDGKVNSTPATSLVTVSVQQPTNHAPTITSTPVTTANVGTLYSYDVTATDSDNDTLTYSLSLFPTGMSINAQSGLISWTPTANQVGSQSVNVKVTDGKNGNDSQPFSISVTAANQTTVPNLVNQSRAAAEAAIQQAKLNVGTLTFQHNAKADGLVISQSPAANSSASIGAAVNLTVSLGPDNGLPPNPATVAPALDQTVATSTYDATQFLYSGSNPIQTLSNGQPLAQGTIDPRRAAVIRGKVLDKQNNPLSGVTVSILNHPELGKTQSRFDGWFDLAVNGGGLLTINYQKTGFISSQRQNNVPWQDYKIAEDVVLINLDTKVTAIDLTANTAQVAQGSPVTDKVGTRKATLLFPSGTQATLTLSNGSTSPISNFHLRATEFTVGPNGPQSMPANLPPSSAYTYEVEYSLDEAEAAGATRISFNHPIISYTENFLGFPVGIVVPYGEYDRKQGVWIPRDNGLVIKIIGATQGLASLDLDGSGQAASAAALAALGISTEELQKLAALYPSGQSLWRVPIDQFLAIN